MEGTKMQGIEMEESISESSDNDNSSNSSSTSSSEYYDAISSPSTLTPRGTLSATKTSITTFKSYEAMYKSRIKCFSTLPRIANIPTISVFNKLKRNSAPACVRLLSIDPTQSLNLKNATIDGVVVIAKDEKSLKAEEMHTPIAEELDVQENDNENEYENMPHSSACLRKAGVNSMDKNTKYKACCPTKDGCECTRTAGKEKLVYRALGKQRAFSDGNNAFGDIMKRSAKERVSLARKYNTGERIRAPTSIYRELHPLSSHSLKMRRSLKNTQPDLKIDIVSHQQAALQPAMTRTTSNVSIFSQKASKFRRFFGSTMRKTMTRAKGLAADAMAHVRNPHPRSCMVKCGVRVKKASSRKHPGDFKQVQLIQDMPYAHNHAIWCMRFSSCGRFLATAGADGILRVWILQHIFRHFTTLRSEYAVQEEVPELTEESFVTPKISSAAVNADTENECYENELDDEGPFHPHPFAVFEGHTADLLDVAWSKNYFILSCSMDKTVRLWHVLRLECFCCFRHEDAVTAVAFHPRDDRFFISGTTNGMLRYWNVLEKQVVLWNQIVGDTKCITTADFCQDGKYLVVGVYDGRCIFYLADQLKYQTQINARSTRRRNPTGRKVSGIDPMRGENKILVATNDSRVRLFNLDDLSVECKYKGYSNKESQIKASFSADNKYIIAGSENHKIYIWKTFYDESTRLGHGMRNNKYWERIDACNHTQVTCALFAPHPELFSINERKALDEAKNEDGAESVKSAESVDGGENTLASTIKMKSDKRYFFVSADYAGVIKVFCNVIEQQTEAG